MTTSFKKIVTTIVAALDIYDFVSWTNVFNHFSTQTERQQQFLKSWIIFDSVHTLGVTMMAINLMALIYLHTKPRTNIVFRVAVSIVYGLFLIYSLWSFL